MIGYIKIFFQILIMVPQFLKTLRELKNFIDDLKKKNQLNAIEDIKNAKTEEDRNEAIEKLTSNI